MENDYPKDPGEIRVTKDKPTAAELEKWMAAWLSNAEETGTIKKLFFIGQMLGERGEPYPYRTAELPMRIRSGEITLHYNEIRFISDGNVVQHGTFRRFIVTRGGTEGLELMDYEQRLAAIFEGEATDMTGMVLKKYPPLCVQEIKKKNFFIPGTWVDELLLFERQAILKKNELDADEEKEKREKLLAILGLKPKEK